MKTIFQNSLSENSLSTGFTVKVSGECRKCSRVVTSESSMYAVLTISICSDISGDNSSHFLHEVKQVAKLKQCPCACEDFFQCKSSLVVKVKFTLNTLSGRSHNRSWVRETLLEESWKKEHGQYCLTIISLLFCLFMC